jgi:hypothetical protein
MKDMQGTLLLLVSEWSHPQVRCLLSKKHRVIRRILNFQDWLLEASKFNFVFVFCKMIRIHADRVGADMRASARTAVVSA